MNTRNIARAIGLFVLVLGVGGLLAGERQLGNLMNTDLMLDMTRIALGAILLGSSFMGDKAIKSAFAVFGIVYLGNFLIALISPSMFGLLPHEFGMADNLIHLVGGLLGVGLAFIHNTGRARA